MLPVEAQELVTKDFLRAELAEGLGALETRLTLRIGGAFVASTLILGAIGLLR